MDELTLQNRIRLEWPALTGGPIWRNNVGACRDETGRMIRYGLCNDSAQLNRQIKSSDLIGIQPMLVEQRHVGTVVGVFTAIECKAPTWRMRPGDERATAQARFIDIVREHGGRGGFARSMDDVMELLT